LHKRYALSWMYRLLLVEMAYRLLFVKLTVVLWDLIQKVTDSCQYEAALEESHIERSTAGTMGRRF
jgi:hypothetical protein